MCNFLDTVKITKSFLYIVYIDILEQMFYNDNQGISFGLVQKGVKSERLRKDGAMQGTCQANT